MEEPDAREADSYYKDAVAEFSPTKAISAAALDVEGRIVALAAKQGLYLALAQKPSQIFRTLNAPASRSRRTDSSLGRLVHWSPHAASSSIVASSSGNSTFVWDASTSAVRGGPLTIVEGHTRAVKGLAWSSLSPSLLATCSLDTYVNVWDLRTPRQAVKFKTFRSWTDGATAVKWNRFNDTLLASSHGGEVRVWDLRKESTPWTSITAHNSKINCIDWSYTREHDLLTCGLDRKVKFWNITMPHMTKDTIQHPVTHAAFLPVGEGVVTLTQREDNNVRLWTLASLSEPVHTFSGHQDLVTSVDFRTCSPGSDGTLCQVATFSRDDSLRLWAISPKSLAACGFAAPATHSPTEGREQPSESSESAINALLSEGSDSQPSALALQQEFAILRSSTIPGAYPTYLNVTDRRCTAEIRVEGREIRLELEFPPAYPAARMTFEISFSTLSQSVLQKIAELLNNRIAMLATRKQPAVESILTYAAQLLSFPLLMLRKSSCRALEQLLGEGATAKMAGSGMGLGGPAPEASKPPAPAHELPCPRLAGATFAQDGRLVSFSNFKMAAAAIPRTYDQLVQFVASPEDAHDAPADITSPSMYSGMSYVYSEADSGLSLVSSQVNPAERSKQAKRRRHNAAVSLIDASALTLMDVTLARKYKISGAPVSELCLHNAEAARQVGRSDLVRTWQILSVSTAASVYPQLPPAREHVRGRAEMLEGAMGGRTETRSGLPALSRKRKGEREAGKVGLDAAMGDENFLKNLTLHSSGDFDLQSASYAARGRSTSSLPRVRPMSPEKLKMMSGVKQPSRIVKKRQMWVAHPLGQSLVASLVAHYLRLKDVQTLAVMVCVLAGPQSKALKVGDAPGSSLLHEEQRHLHNHFRRVYAAILRSWGESDVAVEVLKVIHEAPKSQANLLLGAAGGKEKQDLEFGVFCRSCGEAVTGKIPHCRKCASMAFACSLCNLPVRGLSSFCLHCGHGGHTSHMNAWFAKEDICATGCGCRCLHDHQFFRK